MFEQPIISVIITAIVIFSVNNVNVENQKKYLSCETGHLQDVKKNKTRALDHALCEERKSLKRRTAKNCDQKFVMAAVARCSGLLSARVGFNENQNQKITCRYELTCRSLYTL